MIQDVFEKIGAASAKTILPLGEKCDCFTEGEAYWYKQGNALPGPINPETGMYPSFDGAAINDVIFRSIGMCVVAGMLVAGLTTALVIKGLPKTRRRAVYRRRATTTRRRTSARIVRRAKPRTYSRLRYTRRRK